MGSKRADFAYFITVAKRFAKPQFEGLVADRPDLAGHFPNEIESNYATGVYVPSDKVPGALAWAERTVGRFPASERNDFRGLLAVLEHAAGAGLAYWEGTDLGLPMATVRRIEPGVGNNLAMAEPPCEYATFIGAGGSIIVLNDATGRDHKLVFANLETWPPSFRELRCGYGIRVVRSSSGRWLIVAGNNRDDPEDGPSRYFRVLEYDRPPEGEPARSWDCPVKNRHGFSNAGFVGDRIVA